MQSTGGNAGQGGLGDSKSFGDGRDGAGGAGAQGVQAAGSGNTRGVIDISVLSGAKIDGGAASTTSGADGAAVSVIDGGKNTLTNEGTLTSSSGTAVLYSGSGSLDVQNFGKIHGSIPTGDGDIAVTNRADGVLSRATSYGVTSLRNRGTLITPGSDRGLSISGGFYQTATGTTQIRSISTSAAALQIGGAASVAGTVMFDLGTEDAKSLLAAQSGTFPAVEVAGGVTLDDDTVTQGSAVAQFFLDQVSSTLLNLGYDIDFANDDIKLATNDTQDRLVERLDAMFQNGDLSDAAADEAAALVLIDDADDFALAADSLSGEVYANTQLSALYAAQIFRDTFMSCSARGGQLRFVTQEQCGWFFAGGSRFDQDANTTSTGFTQNAFVLSAGAQFEVAPDTHLGFALGYRTVR